MSQRGDRTRPRGPAPAGPGGGVASSAGVRGALLLGAAVLIGIVLLQKFDTGTISTGAQISTATTARPQATTSTTRRVGLTTVPLVTTSTVKARAKADVKVVVANGAGVKGLGASTTATLKTAGYTNILTPVDATTTVDKTVIQFAEGYDAEAKEVAATLGLPATVAVKLASPPVAAADIGDAKVIVIMGLDSTTTSAQATTSTTKKL